MATLRKRLIDFVCASRRRHCYDVPEMKRKLHQCLLGLSLLVIVPGAILGVLIAVGAIGSGIQSGFSLTDFIAIPLLLVPSFLGWWGARLFFRLYAGFLARVRRALFWFYTVVTIYCGMWLISTFSRDGTTGSIFAPQEQTIGFLLLLLPLLIVAFMSPDELPDHTDNNDNTQRAGSSDGM